MSEPEQSGAPTAAPADSPAAPAPNAPVAASTQPIGLPIEASAKLGAFGSTKGSGLLRGKRPATATASAPATTGAAGYKPTALEVITPQREYKNPFTGETTVSAPASPEPVERVANEPAPQAAPSAPVPSDQVAPPPSVASAKEDVPAAPQAAPAGELFPFNPPASSDPKAAPAADSGPKPELKILPTEQPKRPVVGWEAPKPAAPGQPPARDERGSFRPERREERKFEPREPRRDERKFEPRTNQPYQPRDDRDRRPEQAAPAKKSGGFLGWLKGLFGGGKSADAPAPDTRESGREGGREGNFEGGQRRRHRGGRGRGRGGFDRGGPREGQQQPRDPRDEGGQPNYGGEPRGEGDRGGYRHGRRGGRGRFRDGGDRGGRDPRPEGQQGGGAI